MTPQFKVGLLSVTVLTFLAFKGGNYLNLFMLLATLAIHEISHLFCCAMFEYRVLEIRLTPFGGSLKIDPLFETNPVAESFIAAAGPLSNLLMAGGVFYLKLLGITNCYLNYWQITNLAIGIINLIPAFPLDGGRILHSWLNKNLGFENAVFWSKLISFVVAILVLVFGAVKLQNGSGVIFITSGFFILFHVFKMQAPHLDYIWQLLQHKKRLLQRKGILNLKPMMVTPQTPIRVPLQKYGTHDYLLFFIFNDEDHFTVIGEELAWELLINKGFTATFQDTLKLKSGK